MKYAARFLMAFFLYWSFCNAQQVNQQPRLTVIIVIDQFAYHYLYHIRPYFQHGFKKIFSEGIEYTNAYFPHGTTSTATGHAGLSTGTYAKEHGFIGNRWIDQHGNEIKCDDDRSGQAAIFSEDSNNILGKSAHFLMVDTLADQFVLHGKLRNAYSFSLKSRAAIPTAGKLGKAIWFDDITGHFTSSRAYFKQLPQWLLDFNKKQKQNIERPYFWDPCYDLNSAAYQSATKDSYLFVELDLPRINTLLTTPSKACAADHGQSAGVRHRRIHTRQKAFLLTPAANQMLFDVTYAGLNQEILDKKNNEQALVWICLSSLDKLGHFYGPQSFEILDMIYHLDKQLDDFMIKIQEQVGKDQVLFVLTADHGVAPLPELLQQAGYSGARRIRIDNLIVEMNYLIHEKFGIKDLIIGYKTPQFFLDNARFEPLLPAQREKIENSIKEYLRAQPGISRAWSFDELEKSCEKGHTRYLRDQLFKGRSGPITILVEPYCIDTNWMYGTDHRAPYECNRHVPLVFYWPGRLAHKIVTDQVWTLQLASSLALLLGIQKPSASLFDPLPGLVIKDPRLPRTPADLVSVPKSSPEDR